MEAQARPAPAVIPALIPLVPAGGLRDAPAGRLVLALKEIVQDYSPSTHLLKRVIPARAVPA